MNTKTTQILALVFFVAAFTPTLLVAQEWSSSQKEVWKVVEEMEALWSKGDVDGLYKYIHPDFVWWTYGTPVPFSIKSAKQFDALVAKNSKVLEYDLKPLTILVYDAFAVVNSVWVGFQMETGEKLKYSTYRSTGVFKKEGAKWLLVANHWGAYSQLK